MDFSNPQRFQQASKSSIQFAQDILRTELPSGVFDDYTELNPKVAYRAWILTNNYVNLWSAQFSETTEHDAFFDIETLFFQSLFTRQKMAIYYDDQRFKLFNVIHDDVNNDVMVTLREFDETQRLYPTVKFHRDDILIVRDTLAFSRWTYAFLTNLEIAKLYDVTFITTLAESKKFEMRVNSTNPETLRKFWERFLQPKPWVETDSIVGNKGELPNVFTPMELGPPTASTLFDQLLKFQAFHAEMLGVTQATDTKAERLTAGENVININNINLINQLILKNLNRIGKKINQKWNIQLQFALSTTLTPNLMNEEVNNALLNDQDREVDDADL